MSQAEEFPITLVSNVPGNPNNTPAMFETHLARELDLPGDWEVALIDMSYPHSWLNLDKEIPYVVMQPKVRPPDTAPADAPRAMEFPEIRAREGVEYDEIIDGLSNDRRLNDWKSIRHTRWDAGNYSLERLVAILQEDLRGSFAHNVIEVLYNEENQKVRIGSTYPFVIASYSDNSLLRTFGFTTSTRKIERLNKRTIEYYIFTAGKTHDSDEAPQLKRFTNIFVYSDIVEQTLIGNTQAAFLGYFPITSKYSEQGYWCFNPAYYVGVREKRVADVTIKVCDEYGEQLPIVDGLVICRLNFKRKNIF